MTFQLLIFDTCVSGLRRSRHSVCIFALAFLRVEKREEFSIRGIKRVAVIIRFPLDETFSLVRYKRWGIIIFEFRNLICIGDWDLCLVDLIWLGSSSNWIGWVLVVYFFPFNFVWWIGHGDFLILYREKGICFYSRYID